MAVGTQLGGALDAMFRSRAAWVAERDPFRRVTNIRYRCTSPVFSATDEFLEDAIDASGIVMRECTLMYNRHHAPLPTIDLPPLITCGQCRAPVPLIDEPKEIGALHEFCERQAVLWMERAQRVRK